MRTRTPPPTMMIAKQIDRPQCKLRASIKTALDATMTREAEPDRTIEAAFLSGSSLLFGRLNTCSSLYYISVQSMGCCNPVFDFCSTTSRPTLTYQGMGHHSIHAAGTTDDNCHAIIALTFHEVICHLPPSRTEAAA